MEWDCGTPEEKVQGSTIISKSDPETGNNNKVPGPGPGLGHRETL